MKLRNANALAASIILLLAISCRSPEITPISGNTYLISASSAFNGTSKKDLIIREANKFAQSKGKVAVAISLKESHPAVGLGGQFEYQFKLVDPDSPEANNTSLMPRPDVVIEKTEKVTADVPAKDTAETKKDLYTELTKLDDLRKKGILTNEEFEAQKKKLLADK